MVSQKPWCLRDSQTATPPAAPHGGPAMRSPHPVLYRLWLWKGTAAPASSAQIPSWAPKPQQSAAGRPQGALGDPKASGEPTALHPVSRKLDLHLGLSEARMVCNRQPWERFPKKRSPETRAQRDFQWKATGCASSKIGPLGHLPLELLAHLLPVSTLMYAPHKVNHL